MAHHADLVARGIPHLGLRTRVLTPEEGGRSGPITSGCKPQLSLGQHLVDGTRVVWDCVWLVPAEGARPGDQVEVVMCLSQLPISVISRHEHLEFYEGPRLIAAAEVKWIWAPGHPHHEAGDPSAER